MKLRLAVGLITLFLLLSSFVSAQNQGGSQGPKVVISDPTTGATATVFSTDGEMRVTNPPAQIYLDSFDGGLDTTNKWTSTNAGGGSACTNVVTATTCGTGTTANGYSFLIGKVSYPPADPGWNQTMHAINLQSPIPINSYLAWGTGTNAATPTALAPLTDAAVFEIKTVNGISKMFAAMWQGGTEQVLPNVTISGIGTLTADLSASTGSNKQPTDTATHYYFVYYRGDQTYWAIDSLSNIVFQTTNGAPGPNINTLPPILIAVAGAVAPSSSATITDNKTWVADTSRQLAIDPCQSGSVEKQSVPISLTSATTTALVAPLAAERVYVCGLNFTISPSATSADIVSFITGSGATCGTNTVTKTGTYGNGDLTSAAAVVPVNLISSGEIFTSAIGAGVCAISAGTAISIQGIMSYVQR